MKCRTLSGPVESPKSHEESPGREARDVGSASFAANVYPVQVDLTEWTRKFEKKFGDFTKLVDLSFKALNSLVNGNF